MASKLISNACAEYAFVVATAISGPALIYSVSSASLAIDEPTTFTIAKVSIPSSFAFRSEDKVSAVSPL